MFRHREFVSVFACAKALIGFTAVLSTFTATGRAADKEPTAVVEIGAAGDWGLPGATSFGPTVALEFTAIKDRLEIEAGAAALINSRRTEWDTDLLFKKPFTLSDKVELEIGVGPGWTFSRDGTKVAGVGAADFMFWPTQERRFGWFLEPSYSYSFSKGHDRSLGISVGVLIAVP